MGGNSNTLVLNAVEQGLDQETTLRRRAADPAREAADEVQEGILCEICWQVLPPSDPEACPVCSSPRPDAGWAEMPYALNPRYLFVQLLGRGAMGAVFLAVDRTASEDATGRKPVRGVKVIQRLGKPEDLEKATRMFEHEASASALLGRSPYFVKTYGYELGAQPFLVMELVQWSTLSKLLSAGPLSSIRTAELGIALLQAVEVMHFYRVVHRDLKPSNLFIHEAGGAYRIKIADLGIWTRDHDAGVPESLRIHSTIVHGTTGYMSPEQMASNELGCRSDLHAIGSILWEACTGHLPFPVQGETILDQIRSRLEQVKHIPPCPSSMSEELYDVLRVALAHDPDERFQTAREMTEALRRCLGIAKKKRRWREGAQRELSAVAETFAELESDSRLLPVVAERLQDLRTGIDTMQSYFREGGTVDPKVFNGLMSQLRRDLSEIKAGLDDPYLQVRPSLSLDVDASPTIETLQQGGPVFGRDIHDRYDIDEIVGAGGIAQVYDARHRQLGRRVAIKRMNQTIIAGLTEEQQQQLFEAEAQSASVLEHPNSVFVLDYDIGSDGLPYLVMEYISGESLAEYLREHGALSESQALDIFAPVCSALAEAHAHGVTHRNLKPSRIVFKHIAGSDVPMPKLYGFGPHKDVVEKVIPKGMLFGTPKYMAPEQLRTKEVGPAADIYALGTLIFEALSGHVPFVRQSLRESLAAKIKEDPPLLPEGFVSEALRVIIGAMLQRHPEARPTASLLHGWFTALRHGHPEQIPLRRLRESSSTA